MKWLFLCSLFLFLSCPGLIQAPPAQPGSGIPIGSGNQDPNNPADPNNNLYPGHPNAPGDPNNPANPNNPNNPNNQDLPVTLPSDRQWGLVRCDERSWPYLEFNKQLKNFLSTSNDPNRMNWWVKCDFTDQRFKNWKGGVFIRGKISFQRDKFNPVSESQNLHSFGRSSHLEIHIVDHLQKTVITPIRMQLAELSSSISGNNVTLVFKDEKGEITLKGTVNKNPKINDFTVSGDMTFINYVDYKGVSRKYGGFLGYFEIPACSFLDCAN